MPNYKSIATTIATITCVCSFYANTAAAISHGILSTNNYASGMSTNIHNAPPNNTNKRPRRKGRSRRDREIEFNENLKSLCKSVNHHRHRTYRYGRRANNNKHHGGVERAEKLLFETLEAYEHQRTNTNTNTNSTQQQALVIRPNHYSFGIVINGWAKISQTSHTAAQRAEDLLQRMEQLYTSGKCTWIKPDVVKYTSCIHAWAKSRKRGSAHRAEKILRRMEQLYYLQGDASVKPNAVTYAAVIDAWCRNRQRNPNPNNNNNTNNNDARSISISKSAPHRAEDILKRMEFRYQQSGGTDRDVEPDIVVYNSVLHAWAKHGTTINDAPFRAEAILRRMVQRYAEGVARVKPDVQTYNIVLDGWATAAGKCKHLHKNNNDNDNDNNHNNDEGLLWGRGAAERAEQILVQMEGAFFNATRNSSTSSSMSSKKGQQNIQMNMNIDVNVNVKDWIVPTTISYNTVINAWMRFLRDGSSDIIHMESTYSVPQRAEDILKRMCLLHREGRNEFAKPDEVTFKLVEEMWEMVGNSRRAGVIREWRDLYLFSA